jgi:YVTN family beta-propeller protein
LEVARQAALAVGEALKLPGIGADSRNVMSYLRCFSFLVPVAFSRFFTAAALLPIASTPAVAHVRSYAFVPNAGTDRVDVIDTTANAILATIPVGDGPRATRRTSWFVDRR